MRYAKENGMSLDILTADMLAAAQIFGKTSRDMVYGEGPSGAALCLLGEAPGAEETRLSRPFVGRAGKNLNEFLAAIRLNRPDIYITNVVKFRPCKTSAKGTVSNRPPDRAELACMHPLLLRELEMISPRVVVTLGNVPLKCLLGDKATIGTHHAVPVEAAALSHTFTLFPLYHPASVIYNPALRPVYEQDLIKLRHLLDTLGIT
jgi:uracil-DNA glycosylase family 4